MRQPIVKDLRSKTKAKDFLKCPRGQGHGLEDFITEEYDDTYLLVLVH